MFVSVRDMGKRGVNTELPPYELDPNEFTRVENVRFWNGTAQRHPDPILVTQEGVSWNIPEPIWFETWINREATTNYAYASKQYLWVWSPTAPGWEVKNKPSYLVSGYTSTEAWQSVVFGDTVIFNNGQDEPQMFEDGAANFDSLTAWPANTTCKVMRKFKNFLVAMGITDTTGSVYYHNRLRWSDAAAANSVPGSWDIADDTVLAGENTISADDGEIVDGRELGDVFIIYTKKAVYEMSFIGAPYVMAFRKISDNSLLNVNCVAAYDNFHFCVGEREIYVHDGQNIQHIANQRVRDTFFGELVNKDSVRVEVSPITKEVFVVYNSDTTDNAQTATRALVWSYEYNTFTFVDMPNINCIKFGYFPGTVTTWAELDTAGTKWSELNNTWAQFASNDLQPTVFLVTDADQVVESGTATAGSGAAAIEDTTKTWTVDEWKYYKVKVNAVEYYILSNTADTLTTFGGTFSASDAYEIITGAVYYSDLLFSSTSSAEVVLERTSLDMDRLLTKPTNTVKLIKEIYPQIEGSGDVTFKLGTQDTPSGDILWTPSQTYTIGQDNTIDLFSCGRYLAWRLEAGAGVNFRMTGIDVDIEEVGRR